MKSPTSSPQMSRSSLRKRHMRVKRRNEDALEMRALYSTLSSLVPSVPKDKKISKTKLLQHVMDYITELEMALRIDSAFDFCNLCSSNQPATTTTTLSPGSVTTMVPTGALSTSHRTPLRSNSQLVNSGIQDFPPFRTNFHLSTSDGDDSDLSSSDYSDADSSPSPVPSIESLQSSSPQPASHHHQQQHQYMRAVHSMTQCNGIQDMAADALLIRSYSHCWTCP